MSSSSTAARQRNVGKGAQQNSKGAKNNAVIPPSSNRVFQEDGGQESLDSPTDRDFTDGEAAAQQKTLSPQDERDKKMKSIKERVFYSCVMISVFSFIIALGHLYVSWLVIGLTFGMFWEIVSLKRNVEKDNKIPLFRTLRWYFFLLVEFAMMRGLLDTTAIDALIFRYGGPVAYNVLVRYHTFTTYMGFLGGILVFVLTLHKFTLRYQFYQLGWTFLTIFLVVIQCGAHLSNIYSGLVWFLLSTTLVIANDTFAYIVGVTIGRTPLIALSPKKTVEGFVGGAVFTAVWAIFAVNILASFDFFLCPQRELIQLPFEALMNLKCSNEVKGKFEEIIVVPGLSTSIKALHVHAFVLSMFASFVAPFGGFLASGFKRAFRLKDFGDLIPGHGGFTDRFDCQIVMGMFCFMYLNTFVYGGFASLEAIKKAAESLTDKERAELINYLRKI